MTDTGQVPGQGQPENAGGHHGQPQAVPSPVDPGTAQHPGEYAYLGPAEGSVEDDDLLMPGAQGAWSEHGVPQVPTPASPQPQAVPAQQTAPFEPPIVPEQVPAAARGRPDGRGVDHSPSGTGRSARRRSFASPPASVQATADRPRSSRWGGVRSTGRAPVSDMRTGLIGPYRCLVY